MPFSVASYNILADAYIKPAWYPGTPPSFLAAEKRRPALLRHIQDLAADVICLQEVEPDMLQALTNHFQPLGYVAHYTQKSAGKPDGCATLVKRTRVEVRATHTLYYRDGGGRKADSGHVALVLILGVGSRAVGIANTHLKWDPPGTPREEQWGYRQITELLQQRSLIAPTCQAWIICGDFNNSPDSDVMSTLEHADLEDAYRGRESVYTCNSNRKVKRIDYILHSRGLTSRAMNLPVIADHTGLPSESEPSDHLAIMAWFDWTTPETG